MLYLAVEVDPKVNDDVFGTKSDDGAYMASANGSATHTADRLIGSDHVQLSLQCGEQSYSWNHGYLYDLNGDEDPTEADWLSGPGDPSIGGGSPPGPWPWLKTASSLQWNMNHAAELGAAGWDVTLGGTRIGSSEWKSVDDLVDGDGDVTNDGWGTTWYNSAYGWEWKIVYEMSIDLRPDGADCGGHSANVQVDSAHNSPAKDYEDVPIPMLDLGDAPDSHKTLLASDGARHVIPVDLSGPFMGAKRDTDADGAPTAGADGDDLLDGNDNEDGGCWCRGR